MNFRDSDSDGRLLIGVDSTDELELARGEWVLRVGGLLVDRGGWSELVERHGITYTPSIGAEIRRLRNSLLVTSYLYYDRTEDLITDVEWDTRARRLEYLQTTYPELCDFTSEWGSQWIGFTSATGCHLRLRDPRMVGKAEYLLGLRRTT